MLRLIKLMLAGGAALALLGGSTTAAVAGSILLHCQFDNGRYILGVVVFPERRKMRMLYGDGGSQEWTDVDFSKDPIKTADEGGRRLTLSRDFTRLTFDDAEGSEHAQGVCSPTAGKTRDRRPSQGHSLLHEKLAPEAIERKHAAVTPSASEGGVA